MDQTEQTRASRVETMVALLNIALVALSVRLFRVGALFMAAAVFGWAIWDHTTFALILAPLCALSLLALTWKE